MYRDVNWVPDGTLYFQKRSTQKLENAGLIDKPIGGHVGLGDDYDSAAIHEANDELAIPAAILPEEDMLAIIRTRKHVLDHQAILMRVGILENDVSKGRTLKGKEPWDEIGDTAVYFGLYNGSVKFKDGESTGIEVNSLEELKANLQSNPENYTSDIGTLVNFLEERGTFRLIRQ